MSFSENPWRRLPQKSPFVLPEDAEMVANYNTKVKVSNAKNFLIHLDILPEPFLGRPDAPVVLLGLNAGFNEEDPNFHKHPRFIACSRRNLLHSPAKYPFYLLHPKLETSGWWKRKLGPLIDRVGGGDEQVGLVRVAQGILCVEYFTYHSKRFKHRRLKLASQQYNFELVRQAIRRDAVIILMRSERLWFKAVPELKDYSRLCLVNSVLNPTISLKNCPEGFGLASETLGWVS